MRYGLCVVVGVKRGGVYFGIRKIPSSTWREGKKKKKERKKEKKKTKTDGRREEEGVVRFEDTTT